MPDVDSTVHIPVDDQLISGGSPGRRQGGAARYPMRDDVVG
jgi:hypothetical protein